MVVFIPPPVCAIYTVLYFGVLPSNAYTFDNGTNYPSTEHFYINIIITSIESCMYSISNAQWAVVMSMMDMKYATSMYEYGHVEAAQGAVHS